MQSAQNRNRFFLVLVILDINAQLVKSFDGDLSVFHIGDSAENFRENSRIHRNNFKKRKFVDIYTNHPDQKEVVKSFYKNYNPQNRNAKIYKNSDSPVDRKDTFHFQNIDDVFSYQKKDSLESEYGHFESITDSESNSGNQDQEFFKNKYHFIDRNKYYYPDSTEYTPFITKDVQEYIKDPERYQLPLDKERNKFVFLQNQMVIPDSENYGSFYSTSHSNLQNDYRQNARPSFLTKKYNFSGEPQSSEENIDGLFGGYRYSYVQKIPSIKERSTTASPKDSTTDSNKYEEMELTQSDKVQVKKSTVPDTKKRINDLLKKYLAKLFVEKYADKKDDHNKSIFGKNVGNTSPYTLVQNIANHKKSPKADQESKILFTDALWDLKNRTITKIKNLFSIFTLIKFDNTECNATNWAGTWQGVCYTSGECADMNGTALGDCASGYGVCCVFRGSCGDSSSRNCSYFKSPNYPDYYPSDGGVITPTTTTVSPTNFPTPDPRLHWYHYKHGTGDEELDNIIKGRQTADGLSCAFSVLKSDPEVKQLKIDFIDLDLASPTNGTCTNERLVISGQNTNNQIPVICGYNTGQHVYVDVSELTEPLQIMVLSTTGDRKRFKLRICQYTDSCGKAQSNCLQYYTGVSGIIESFNYDQAAMFNRSSPGYFNNLNYAICIRREAGYCSITYTNARNGQVNPFQLVNRLPGGQLTIPPGQAGVDILNCPDDYIIIDGTRLCGDRFNDGSTVLNFSMNAPVTDTSAGPIVINVRTNNNVTGLGFKLYYMQNECTTT